MQDDQFGGDSMMTAMMPEEPVRLTDVTPEAESVASAQSFAQPVEETSAAMPFAASAQEPVAPVAVSAPVDTPAPTEVPAAPVQEVANGPDQPKKKSHLALIIILVVFAIAAIVATGLIAYNIGKNDGMATRKSNNSVKYDDGVDDSGDDIEKDADDSGDDEKKDDDGEKDDGGEKDDDKSKEDEAAAALKKRNQRREDDIARFLTAVNDFQVNNSGKTPFQVGLLGRFTKRYIDDKCTDSADGKTISGNTCGAEFRDPDGEQYGWKSLKATSGDVGKKITTSTAKVDHVIYAVQAASCGSTDGTYSYYAGDRNIALLYVGEGGVVICNDNH